MRSLPGSIQFLNDFLVSVKRMNEFLLSDNVDTTYISHTIENDSQYNLEINDASFFWNNYKEEQEENDSKTSKKVEDNKKSKKQEKDVKKSKKIDLNETISDTKSIVAKNTSI